MLIGGHHHHHHRSAPVRQSTNSYFRVRRSASACGLLSRSPAVYRESNRVFFGPLRWLYFDFNVRQRICAWTRQSRGLRWDFIFFRNGPMPNDLFLLVLCMTATTTHQIVALKIPFLYEILCKLITAKRQQRNLGDDRFSAFVQIKSRNTHLCDVVISVLTFIRCVFNPKSMLFPHFFIVNNNFDFRCCRKSQWSHAHETREICRL